MTSRNPMENGAERLYDEDVTPRNSLAFNIGRVILGKIFKGIGIGIDRGLDALGIGRYFRTPAGEGQGQQGYETGKTQKALGSSYCGMDMHAVPVYSSPGVLRSIYSRRYME